VRFEDTLCNYANSLILCDRLCGTFLDGEAELVGQDDRKRLTIREQFMFPFKPMLEWIKARQGQSASA
jgi:sterol desaturase/sphingolipid hydroxylase (fatty acid hydroxylase superfamily)